MQRRVKGRTSARLQSLYYADGDGEAEVEAATLAPPSSRSRKWVLGQATLGYFAAPQWQPRTASLTPGLHEGNIKLNRRSKRGIAVAERSREKHKEMEDARKLRERRAQETVLQAPPPVPSKKKRKRDGAEEGSEKAGERARSTSPSPSPVPAIEGKPELSPAVAGGTVAGEAPGADLAAPAVPAEAPPGDDAPGVPSSGVQAGAP